MAIKLKPTPQERRFYNKAIAYLRKNYTEDELLDPIAISYLKPLMDEEWNKGIRHSFDDMLDVFLIIRGDYTY